MIQFTSSLKEMWNYLSFLDMQFSMCIGILKAQNNASAFLLGFLKRCQTIGFLSGLSSQSGKEVPVLK